MQFNSLKFLIFFPVVTLVFFMLPKKVRYLWLLAASYYFYMSWNPWYAFLMLFSTLATYLCAFIIGEERKTKENSRLCRIALVVGIVTNLAVLFLFKYLDFGFDVVNRGLTLLHLTTVRNPFHFILPVGISFYTFQALGYLIDVYRNDTQVEKNFFRYALFVSFFPQLVAGPIERSGRLLTQLRRLDEVRFDYERVVRGLMTMLWGFFMKVMIADRAAVVANTVYDDFAGRSAFALIMGTVMFAVQIYCDFASYSVIAAGSARVLGLTLMDNFDTPYFAMSVREFWRRWHISLSTWFRDYVYIPLGGSRRGKARKALNTLLTFLISGLWHGANYTFIVWGALHGLYQVTGDLLSPAKRACERKLRIRTNTFSWKLGKAAVTFALVNFAWIFFRSDSIAQAFTIIRRIFTLPDPWSLTSGAIYELGLARQEMNILLLCIGLLLLVDGLRRRRGIRFENLADGQNVLVRPVIMIALAAVILIFGAYGYSFDAQQFIYFQF